jgi:ABC-type proline/glycine betaine transport system ATPase subunit
VLSFADEVAIIKEGRIIESGIPKFIYDNPNNKYVASLFGDVNEIEINGELKFVYPHQLKVVTNSDFEVEVLKSYFRGNHYLIEVKYLNQSVFFENEFDLEIGLKLNLDFPISK